MKTKETGRRTAAWTASALWMVVIFCMSAAPGDVSGAQSGLLTRLLAALFAPFVQLDAQALALMELIVRKCAHMGEYAVLMMLYRWALMESGVRRPGAWALVMTIGYAASDEFHQAFVPGRGPGIADAMIDTCGAMIGWGMAAFAGWMGKKRKNTKN